MHYTPHLINISVVKDSIAPEQHVVVCDASDFAKFYLATSNAIHEKQENVESFTASSTRIVWLSVFTVVCAKMTRSEVILGISPIKSIQQAISVFVHKLECGLNVWIT